MSRAGYRLSYSTRGAFPFIPPSTACRSQRISVAAQLAAAQEVAEALGLAVAADPRAQ